MVGRALALGTTCCALASLPKMPRPGAFEVGVASSAALGQPYVLDRARGMHAGGTRPQARGCHARQQHDHGLPRGCSPRVGRAWHPGGNRTRIGRPHASANWWCPPGVFSARVWRQSQDVARLATAQRCVVFVGVECYACVRATRALLLDSVDSRAKGCGGVGGFCFFSRLTQSRTSPTWADGTLSCRRTKYTTRSRPTRSTRARLLPQHPLIHNASPPRSPWPISVKIVCALCKFWKVSSGEQACGNLILLNPNEAHTCTTPDRRAVGQFPACGSAKASLSGDFSLAWVGPSLLHCLPAIISVIDVLVGAQIVPG